MGNNSVNTEGASLGQIAAGLIGAAKSNSEGNDALTTFRTSWLRAIAMTWLTGKGDETDAALCKSLVNVPAAWDRLQVEVHRETDFLWVGDTWSWVESPGDPKSNEDELCMYLPLTQKIPEDDLAIALAEYYKARPSIFSSTFRVDPDGPLFKSTVTASPVIWDLLTSRIAYASKGPSPGGLHPNPTSFNELTIVLMSSLAKAWTNENFKKRLLQEPESAFKNTRDFTIPWKMRIQICDDPGVVWDSTKKEWDFTKETKNKLTLCLPMKPERGADQVLALAAYNATGAEYPFTCCP